jgi:hypothetical protein
MSIKLVYHTPESASGGISPFDKAIIRIVTGEDALIVCPYINLGYLKRITDLSKSWRILTDVEEWLASHNRGERVTAQSFINRYLENIRHVKDLHAKVMIAGQRALVGSANFTNMGITGRFEMSVLFEKEPQVEELSEWFDSLWAQSQPIDTEELRACVQSMPARPPVTVNRDQPRMSSQVPPVRSKLKSVERHRSQPVVTRYGEATSEQLIKRVKFAPSCEWIEGYFDLMKLLLETTGLSNDDPRLVTSIPQSDWLLPVSVNNRYVLAPRKQDGFAVGIIYGPEFELKPHLQTQAISDWRFSPLPGEGIDTPFFIRFRDAGSILESPEIRDGWLDAALLEVQRAKSSPYRKFHQSIVYRAAVDLGYRKTILDKAFSDAQ